MNVQTLSQLELQACTALMTARALRTGRVELSRQYMQRAVEVARQLGLHAPDGNVSQYLLSEAATRNAFELGRRDRAWQTVWARIAVGSASDPAKRRYVARLVLRSSGGFQALSAWVRATAVRPRRPVLA